LTTPVYFDLATLPLGAAALMPGFHSFSFMDDGHP
jgi:hypothetical protein